MAGPVIGKLVFGKDGLNFGLELCLARAGLVAHKVTTSTACACDILLVSMFWYRNVYEIELFCREAGIRKGTGKPWIVAGGMQATMTPEIIAQWADWVFVGDADDHLAAVVSEIADRGTCTSPHVYAAGMKSPPAPARCAPSAFAIQTNEDGGTLRCEIARGCKFKCAFCCLSGLKPYTEVRFEKLQPIIKAARGKRTSFFAPERVCHSEWAEIKEALQANGVHDMGQDARLEHLCEVEGATVTFGLEGLSERLRRSVGKPFSDATILDRLGKFVETRKNIARVSVYFIAGLPGETDEDWAAVWSLFEQIGRAEWSRRLVLCPVLNPLSPKPFTKLRDARIDLFADYQARWSRLLRQDGGQWGFRIKETLVWGPWERTLDAIVQRAGAAAFPVIRSIPSSLLKSPPPSHVRALMARDLIRNCERHGITQAHLEGHA